jgi:hypothetical protein
VNISENLVELINSPDRITTLGTADADGTPDTAIIGSAFMAEDDHLWPTTALRKTCGQAAKRYCWSFGRDERCWIGKGAASTLNWQHWKPKESASTG